MASGFVENILYGIIIPVILIIGLAVTIGYLTNAQTNMIVGTDPNQEKAYEWLTWGITIGWIIVVLMIVGVVIAFKKRKGKSKDDSKKLMILTAILFVVYGVIAAVAASNIKKGPDYEANKPYYTDCVWIASTFLGLAGVLFIIWLVRKFKKNDNEVALEEISQSSKNKNEQIAQQQQQINSLTKQNKDLVYQNQQLNSQLNKLEQQIQLLSTT